MPSVDRHKGEQAGLLGFKGLWPALRFSLLLCPVLLTNNPLFFLPATFSSSSLLMLLPLHLPPSVLTPQNMGASSSSLSLAPSLHHPQDLQGGTALPFLRQGVGVALHRWVRFAGQGGWVCWTGNLVFNLVLSPLLSIRRRLLLLLPPCQLPQQFPD